MLVEKAKNIFTPRQLVEAALSHTLSQHLEQLRAADRTAFEHGCDHGQIGQHGRVHQGDFVQHPTVQHQLHVRTGGLLASDLRGWRRRILCGARCLLTRRGWFRRGAALVRGGRACHHGHCRGPVFGAAVRRAPLPVETLLVPAPAVCLIVLFAPLVGLLATMVLTATELAAEISAIRIPRMGQKANSTMAAVDRTACQMGMIAQNGIERQLILTNKRVGAVGLMPIRTK